MERAWREDQRAGFGAFCYPLRRHTSLDVRRGRAVLLPCRCLGSIRTLPREWIEHNAGERKANALYRRGIMGIRRHKKGWRS